MTQIDYGNKECIPKKAECKEKPPVVSNICTDKGKVSHCNDGFKRKFKQLWDRAFSSLISVNGKTQEAGTGNVTLHATDIMSAGEGIIIQDDVISTTGESSVDWGDITGNLNDQSDLKNELTGIIDRVDDNAEAIEALDTAKADVGDSYTKDEEDTKLGLKQNVLTAGDGIVISGPQNNIISATTQTLRWGNIEGDMVDQIDLDNRLSGIETDVSDLEQAVEDLDTEKANASDVYSQTIIDGMVSDLNTAIDGVAASVVTLDDNVYKKTYIDNQLATKQGTLTAGAGIGISANNTISCTVPGFSVQVVSILPATGVTGVIYLVPLLGPTSQNIYNEFIWVDNAWEQIGTTEIDLSQYKIWSETKNYIDDADDALRISIGNVSTAQSRTQGDLMAHERDTSNPHSVTKTQVGLGNVDNTSDLNKPVSTATQTALNGKANVGASYTKSEEDSLLALKASTDQLISGLNGKLNNNMIENPNYGWTWGTDGGRMFIGGLAIVWGSVATVSQQQWVDFGYTFHSRPVVIVTGWANEDKDAPIYIRNTQSNGFTKDTSSNYTGFNYIAIGGRAGWH